MFGNTFYHGLIRKYIIYFGTLFNDIHIQRRDSSGNVQQTIKIPLVYAPKDKMLARIDEDPNLNREYAVNLPMMSFELSNMYYDGDRKLNTLNRAAVTHPTSPILNKYNYAPVAFNFNFTLFIYVKFAEDGTQIIEQILPYFQPDFTASLVLVPELGITRDTPIIHLAARSEDSYNQNFETRRALIWTLDFMLKGELHQPIRTKPVINLANTNVRIPGFETSVAAAHTANIESVGFVYVTPGLDSNGNPTSNASISIPKNEIFANDDYGYIVNSSIGTANNG